MKEKRKPISVSAYNTFIECPQKFKLERIDGIRPIVQMSYFKFGSAIDKALNSLLLGQKDAFEICCRELDKMFNEPTEFLTSDYDGELLSDEVKADLLKSVKECGYQGNDVDSLANALLAKPYICLSDKQKKALTECCVASLKAKARLMIDGYQKHILPKLTEVKDVQKEFRWADEFGNEFVGVIDFTAKFNGVEVTADNKTSSNPFRDYGEDSVKYSVQFSCYSNQTKLNRAAYFVISKHIKKNRVKVCSKCKYVGKGSHTTCNAEIDGERCKGEWIVSIEPEADISVRLEEIDLEEQKIVQSALSDVANAVAAGAFPKNLKSCRTKYGEKTVLCPYYSYCRGGSMNGLKKRST